MKYYWTRFSLSYPVAVVYMLQASEYNLKDYFEWLRRSDDFRKIVKRRNLEYTIKARSMLVIIWIMLLSIYLSAILLIVWAMSSSWLLMLTALLLLITSPLIVGYLVIIPLLVGELVIQRPRRQKILSSARQIIAKHPAYKIAIAGSYGKTTAKEVLYTILREGKKVAVTPGNMNTPIGISRFVQTLDGDEEIIIFEFGEGKVGDVKELCDLVNPDMGIITGINGAHLSNFGTIENIVVTIFELEDCLGDKSLYKNVENSYVKSKVVKNDRLAFSREGVNGWKVSDAKTDISGIDFVAKKSNKKIAVHSNLIGLHNIGILIAAIDIADFSGLTMNQIKAGVASTVPFEHRMQPRWIHDACLLDDTYNGNIDGVKAGLQFLKGVEAKRRVYITPGLVEQGNQVAEIHQEIGREIAQVADVVVLMKNSVTDYIIGGLEDGGFDGKLMVIDEPLEFYTNLSHFVAGGDVVLMQNDWTDNFA